MDNFMKIRASHSAAFCFVCHFLVVFPNSAGGAVSSVLVVVGGGGAPLLFLNAMSVPI